MLWSAAFFAAYFMLPILEEKLRESLFYLLAGVAIVTFWTSLTSPHLWLLLLVLCLDSSLFMPGKAFIRYGLISLGLLSSGLVMLNHWQSLASAVFFFGFSLYVFRAFKESRNTNHITEKNLKKISDDYSRMKRQMVTRDHMARQEERSHIAREIHDSVGHRLTALLMQLEVARHKANDSETKAYFAGLKSLAQDSLHDTRSAVKALKSDETSGIQAVVHLIRKLEAESHLEIRFVIQSGVLGLKLSNAQSVTVYRSIQEALTNMMRHSQTKRATIEFTHLGDRYLQFKVSHPVRFKVRIKEGFGLTSMRNRLEELGGTLSLTQDQKELKVIGQFPLNQ